MGKNGCCGGQCGCQDSSNEPEKHGHDHGHDHSHEGHDHGHEHSAEGHDHNPGNPFDSLDEETQMQIQELQMLEQSFQQISMQKNMMSRELSDNDSIIKELDKVKGEVSKIIFGQVLVKTTKEELVKELNDKKKIISTQLKSIDDKEKNLSKKVEELRESILKKIQK